ncbi:hypothetical protein D041_4141A, partial [Vibrio parahaemolyticus EKP-008]
MGITEHGRT